MNNNNKTKQKTNSIGIKQTTSQPLNKKPKIPWNTLRPLLQYLLKDLKNALWNFFDMYRKDSGMVAAYKYFISLIYNDQLKLPMVTMTCHIQTLISHQLHISIHTKIHYYNRPLKLYRLLSAFSIGLIS